MRLFDIFIYWGNKIRIRDILCTLLIKLKLNYADLCILSIYVININNYPTLKW